MAGFCSQKPILKRIPRACRYLATCRLSSVLDRITSQNDYQGWNDLDTRIRSLPPSYTRGPPGLFLLIVIYFSIEFKNEYFIHRSILNYYIREVYTCQYIIIKQCMEYSVMYKFNVNTNNECQTT